MTQENQQNHSVGCLYEYTLARLSLKDTPEMRVLFWDAHDALEWDEGRDVYIPPVLDGEGCGKCTQADAVEI